MSVEKITDLFKIRIFWEKQFGHPVWTTMIDDTKCLLKMNNFPEEPMYSILWKDQQLDFDDAPYLWVIPHE